MALGYDPEFGQGDHMFNDLALSREILREFHSRLSETSSAQTLSVMVLQRSRWPLAARKTNVDLHPFVRLSLPCSFPLLDASRFVDASRSDGLHDFLQGEAPRTQTRMGPLPGHGHAQSEIQRWQQRLDRQPVSSRRLAPFQRRDRDWVQDHPRSHQNG